jgi:hypothetical protein
MSFFSNLLSSTTAPGSTPIEGLAESDLGYYQSNIQPLQQQLLQTALNPQTIQNNVNQAESGVTQQTANAAGAFGRQLAGQGVVATAPQKANFAKQNALQAGIATAGAANQTRAATASQISGILGET